MTKKMTLLVLAFLLMPLTVFAQLGVNTQFGKNQVMFEKVIWNSYKSAHFEYLFSVDMSNEEIFKYFTLLNQHMERSYEFLSVSLKHDLQRKSIVVVTRTHSQFAALRIHGDPFFPEGINAFAYPREGRMTPGSDLVLVVKADANMRENFRTYTHELVHHFEFNMISRNAFQKMIGTDPVPHWLMEGIAEYLADMFMPSPGGLDLRTMSKRLAAMNVRNPQFDGLPTLYQLRQSQVDVYAFGPMALKFLEASYGRDTVLALLNSLLSERKQGFEELVASLSNGELATPEDFDRAHRKYWETQFDQNMSKYSQSYDKTDNFDGRQIIKRPYPFARLHPVPSPDGRFVAFFQADPKYLGIVLAVAPALPREDPPYEPIDKNKKKGLFNRNVVKQVPEPEVLTKFLPFKPYEYVVVDFEPGLDWWQEPGWMAKVKSADEKELVKLRRIPNVSKIVFFAHKNRDHALFILDVNKRKIISNFEIPLPFDQAFSPVFSPDGQQVYFSAANNTSRHIYAVNLQSETFRQVTGNESIYAQSPAISSDGTKLAYSAFVQDFKKLFMLDLTTGVEKQLTFGRYNDEAPSWSPDGTKIVYVSDEVENTKHLYTLDMINSMASQWTNSPGGVFAPRFMPGENDRLVYTAFEENQFLSYLFRTFKLFDARLKKPFRTFEQKETGETMQLAFRSQEAVSEQLDQGQLDNLSKPSARWKFDGSDINIGTSPYGGAFGYTRFMVQDILANRTHLGLYAQRGSFKYIDYTYLDRQRRWSWATNVKHIQYPLYYFLYSFKGELPRYPSPNGEQNQFVINNTWVKETNAAIYTEYPFSKWSRLEFGVQTRKQIYFMPLSDADIANFGEQLPEIDRQFHDFFKDSNGQINVGFTTAFIHDTVLYSNFGPLHGDALRVQIEHGVGSKSQVAGYQTVQADVRKYIRLSNSSLFAVRAVGLNSTRPTGDVMLMGGSDMLRNYPYFSVAGNQVGYGSAELRFPIPSTYVLGTPVRGVLFGDYTIAKFSNDMFQTRREWAYGIGLQANIFLPMNFEWAKTKFAPDKWTFNFRIGFNF